MTNITKLGHEKLEHKLPKGFRHIGNVTSFDAGAIIICDPLHAENAWEPDFDGVIIYHNDGVYPVFVRYQEDGEVAEVRIMFQQQEEETT
jgi:hypothetical protein